MIDQYVLATNDDGDLAIRTVSATESSSVTDTTSVITATDDGKLAVRVVGGGGDQHNLGYYATLQALQEAYPTAEAGDWAIVGSTDTVWIWDADTSAWVDSDQKGQVTSVNNQTGDVTIGANDVLPSQTGYSGRVLGTDGFVAGWVKPEIVQRSTMPVASQDEEGNVYQFVGTTDANYTNGYFYECVSDGGNPAVYSWVQTNVQPSVDPLPSQSGNSGKFLTTDGTDASWATVNALQNTATGTDSLTINGNAATGRDTVNIGASSSAKSGYNVVVGNLAWVQSDDVAIGYNAYTNNWTSGSVVIGYQANTTSSSSVAIGWKAEIKTNATYGIAIGVKASVSQQRAIQLGYNATNSDANTFKVANANGNFEIMSADGTIPTDRFTTTPVADGTYVPTLTISSGVATRTWSAAASAPVVPATAPTLAVADWSSNTQSITVSGVTSSNVVLVGPAPSSAQDYADAGILCTAQGTDSLTFTCDTVPSNAITLSVVIFG